MNRKGRIYGIFDLLNNKIVYVGKTVNIEDYTPHGKHILMLFYRYPERYVYKVIEENVDETLLDEKERFYIKQYDTYNDKNCFNFTEGGGGGNTFSKLSEHKKIECIEKRIKGNKITKSTEEYKQKMLPIWEEIGKNSKKCLTGRKLPEEHRQKISAGVKRAMQDPEMYKRIAHPGIPKPPRTEEHRKNISKAVKGIPKSEEHRQKIREIAAGRRKITNGVRKSWLFVNQVMPEGWRYLTN